MKARRVFLLVVLSGSLVSYTSNTASAQDTAAAQKQQAATLDSSSLLKSEEGKGITASGYVYQQDFMPQQRLEIDLASTAIFITDPQNDFISEGGGAWPLVGKQVVESKVVEHEVQLREVAREVGIKVFYSPHMYTEMDYKHWKDLNAIDKIMFANTMFKEGTWGHEFHPNMKPDDNTVVMNPHKGLSNFWTGDATIQLRQYGVKTLVLGGMSANLCVESHARDAIENGFEVIIVADATAGAGPYAKKAALVNYEFLAHEVVTTAQIIERLRMAKAAKK